MGMTKTKLRIYSTRITINGESAVQINSRYTYNHVACFHKTIFTILEFRDLLQFSLEDLTLIEDFTRLILNMQDLPLMNYRNQEEYQDCLDELNVKSPRIKIRGKSALRTSKRCLTELLKWIAMVLAKGNMSLDELLDEYYLHFPYAQYMGDSHTPV